MSPLAFFVESCQGPRQPQRQWPRYAGYMPLLVSIVSPCVRGMMAIKLGFTVPIVTLQKLGNDRFLAPIQAGPAVGAGVNVGVNYRPPGDGLSIAARHTTFVVFGVVAHFNFTMSGNTRTRSARP